MTAAEYSSSDRMKSLTAVITAATIDGMLLGLTLPLLAIMMEQRGASALFIGANSAMPALSMLLVTPFIPRIIARVGTMRLLMACLALSICTLTAFRLIDNLWVWFPIRFLNGLAIVHVFVISEIWIQTLATEGRRGQLIGIYTVAFSFGWALGPMILSVTGTESWMPFLVGDGLILISMLILSTARNRAPKLEGIRHKAPLKMIFERPAIFGAVLAFAAIETGIFGLLPVYGLRSGLRPVDSAGMLTAIGLGSMVFQIPLGALSDRMGRHGILLICGLSGLGGAILIPQLIFTYWPLLIGLFIWGGMIAGMYTISMAALGDSYTGDDLSAATASFTVVYGAGSLISPPLSGYAMDIWDPQGLMLVLGLISGIFCIIAGWRWIVVARHP